MTLCLLQHVVSYVSLVVLLGTGRASLLAGAENRPDPFVGNEGLEVLHAGVWGAAGRLGLGRICGSARAFPGCACPELVAGGLSSSLISQQPHFSF